MINAVKELFHLFGMTTHSNHYMIIRETVTDWQMKLARSIWRHFLETFSLSISLMLHLPRYPPLLKTNLSGMK